MGNISFECLTWEEDWLAAKLRGLPGRQSFSDVKKNLSGRKALSQLITERDVNLFVTWRVRLLCVCRQRPERRLSPFHSQAPGQAAIKSYTGRPCAGSRETELQPAGEG